MHARFHVYFSHDTFCPKWKVCIIHLYYIAKAILSQLQRLATANICCNCLVIYRLLGVTSSEFLSGADDCLARHFDCRQSALDTAHAENAKLRTSIAELKQQHATSARAQQTVLSEQVGHFQQDLVCTRTWVGSSMVPFWWLCTYRYRCF